MPRQARARSARRAPLPAAAPVWGCGCGWWPRRDRRSGRHHAVARPRDCM